MKSKKFVYTWDDIENQDKNAATMFEDILSDSELPELEEIVVGDWGEAYDENDSCQFIIDGMIDKKEHFQHIKSLFIGDMTYEECEVSWIQQADYSKLWDALPNLEKLTIKGSQSLVLGNIRHYHLKELEIICGGLPKNALESIAQAELPELKSLKLYLGVEDYGFDGELEDVKKLLDPRFPKLHTLGLMDSDMQDEITIEVCKSTYMDQISNLDLSKGSLTDKGGAVLLEEVPKHPNIRSLNLEFHYMSDDMMKKLSALPVDVNVDDPQEDDEYDGEIYRDPMLTE